MSQNIELKNFELATVNPSNKTWTSADLFCFWANSIQTIAGFALIASLYLICLLYTSPSPRDTERSRMPSSA